MDNWGGHWLILRRWVEFLWILSYANFEAARAVLNHWHIRQMMIVDLLWSRFLEKIEDAALLFSGDFWMFLKFVLFQLTGIFFFIQILRIICLLRISSKQNRGARFCEIPRSATGIDRFLWNSSTSLSNPISLAFFSSGLKFYLKAVKSVQLLRLSRQIAFITRSFVWQTKRNNLLGICLDSPLLNLFRFMYC